MGGADEEAPGHYILCILNWFAPLKKWSIRSFWQSTAYLMKVNFQIKTAGDTLNRLLNIFIWRIFSWRLPDNISDITP